ncbi:hypothetical protein CR513_07488, partial [Mucuna pruriens]
MVRLWEIRIVYFFDRLALVDMGIDLTIELTFCGILGFFSFEQVVCPVLIREFWNNCIYDETAFYGKMLGMDVRIDIPAIATTTWCEREGKKFSLPRLLFAHLRMNLKEKGIKKNHMTHSTLITKIFSDYKVLEAFHALPTTKQVKYGYSFRQQRFGRSNIMPMKLDTLKLIPLLDIKPTKAKLAIAMSKKPTSKRMAPSIRASTKKRKLVLPFLENDEKVVA